MLSSREEVMNSLRKLDDHFNRSVKYDDAPDRFEAAGHVEALMETFREDRDNVRIEFYAD